MNPPRERRVAHGRRYRSPPRDELRAVLEKQIAENELRRRDKDFLQPKIGARSYFPGAHCSMATPYPWEIASEASRPLPALAQGVDVEMPYAEFHGNSAGGGHAVAEAAVQVSAPWEQQPTPTRLNESAGPSPSPIARASDASGRLSSVVPPPHSTSRDSSPSPLGNNRHHFVDRAEQLEQMRRSKELSSVLLSQMDEKRRRNIEKYRREREISRELLSHHSLSPPSKRTSPTRTGDMDAIERSQLPPPAHVVGADADHEIPLPPHLLQHHAGHAAPVETNPASDALLLSPSWNEKKLFDHDRREAEEVSRRQQAAIRQEELRRELERQIEEKRRMHAKEEEDERRAERDAEKRARDNAARRTAEEQQRHHEALRAAQELAQANRHLQHHHEPSRHSAPRHRRGPEEGVADDSSSRARGSAHHKQHDGAHPVPNEDVMAALQAIRDELVAQREGLSRSTPVPIVSNSFSPGASRHGVSARTPSPAPPRQLLRGAVAPERSFDFDSYGRGTDVTMAILERNRNRLGALRHARHHDDILQAFLLQDSTSAMRSMIAMRAKSHSPAALQ